ncbi:X-ray radiation resistance-associated protein 1 [Pempheris klunzingeri]|uniref:X-ray radiation resistance-associated protein 1 n=1 Tax=Pempheris klunzingeri TaxID=3127111 RepID=UPI0039804499
MTAASCKFDDGQRCPTKCFPARTLVPRRKEGAGHWLVAYRKAEQRKHTNVHRRIKETDKEREDKEEGDAARGKTLDGPFLLQLHCVDEPSELCSVDISEQTLSSVKPEDLKVFGNVAYIDASVNSLSLASFSSFVSLRELNLSLNGLCNMTFHAADIPHLEVLNLSYNSLSADAIVSIGRLPRLKVLHLTGNQLHHLPPNLGSSSHDATQLPAGEEDTQFKALEVLMLDDNKLTSGVFSCLANLKRLRYLNLKGNRISEIPCVELTSCSRPLQTEGQATEGQAEEEELATLNTGEHFKRISEIFHKENWEAHCKGSSVPLPELQFLNLADNKITKEEALMAAALFPMLRGIDIHSNPLTTQRSGDPPALTYYLQERLGITIKRKKTQDAGRLPLRVSTHPKWKVEETVPKALKDAAQSQVEKSEPTVKRTAESEGRNSRDEKNTFFVTQTTDAPEYEFDLQADGRETVNKERNKPDRFTSYQMLMDTKPNPDVVEPTGIQTAVRMLEHTLKTLNVYRDSKPKLDSIQTPYRQREKKIKELPPVKPTKPTERVDEMIREIKERTTMREVALSSAMHSTDKQDYKEALSLLRDMKTKYKMVHKKTMEQVAGEQSDGNTNQNGAEPPPVLGDVDMQSV